MWWDLHPKPLHDTFNTFVKQINLHEPIHMNQSTDINLHEPIHMNHQQTHYIQPTLHVALCLIWRFEGIGQIWSYMSNMTPNYLTETRYDYAAQASNSNMHEPIFMNLST